MTAATNPGVIIGGTPAAGSCLERGDTLVAPIVFTGGQEQAALLLGPLPDGFTQEERDRNIVAVSDRAQISLGDSPVSRALLYKFARQCLRHARDWQELMQACGLLPYDHRPQTSFVPRGPVTTGYRRP